MLVLGAKDQDEEVKDLALPVGVTLLGGLSGYAIATTHNKGKQVIPQPVYKGILKVIFKVFGLKRQKKPQEPVDKK